MITMWPCRVMPLNVDPSGASSAGASGMDSYSLDLPLEKLEMPNIAVWTLELEHGCKDRQFVICLGAGRRLPLAKEQGRDGEI